jgi:hypothetical protein
VRDEFLLRIRPAVTAVVTAGLVLLAGGCYDVREADGQTTIRFAAWVQALIVTVPLVLLVGVALFLRRGAAEQVKPWGLFAVLCAVAVGVVPGICLDTVTITPWRITQRTGFWFLPNEKGFAYAGVGEVSIVDHTLPTRRGLRTERHWIVRYRNGTTEDIDPGDLWDNNEDLVVRKLEAYGVRFTGRTHIIVPRQTPRTPQRAAPRAAPRQPR